ncbi:uncharacterized protein LOC134759744 [Pongo abelii]|uniref:uncharacterized protein LOC134759744 n=1 Tax=Pongo abelii TaxID=9601 RepID=UPI003005B2D9
MDATEGWGLGGSTLLMTFATAGQRAQPTQRCSAGAGRRLHVRRARPSARDGVGGGLHGEKSKIKPAREALAGVETAGVTSAPRQRAVSPGRTLQPDRKKVRPTREGCQDAEASVSQGPRLPRRARAPSPGHWVPPSDQHPRPASERRPHRKALQSDFYFPVWTSTLILHSASRFQLNCDAVHSSCGYKAPSRHPERFLQNRADAIYLYLLEFMEHHFSDSVPRWARYQILFLDYIILIENYRDIFEKIAHLAGWRNTKVLILLPQPSASSSQSSRITGVSHGTQPSFRYSGVKNKSSPARCGGSRL